MDLEQTQALDFDGDFDDEDETDDEEAVKKPVAHLKVKGQKEFQEKVFEIYEGDNVIGRHEITCKVWIPLKALSREHACIEVKGDSHFIYDKGSRNKTRRGKAVLKPDVRYELTSNTSVTFGDVEAVYYIGEEVNDNGSETGSESFQTAPVDDEGIDGIKGEATVLVMEEEDCDSDASVDLLQPTQAYHGGRTLNLAPDSDEEDGPHHKPNVTVQDTPFQPKRAGTIGNTAVSTLVLPESDTDDEEEDRRKARVLQNLQTQVVADTQEDDDEEEGEENNNVDPALFGATQAYVMESDTEDDAENTRNTSPAIFAAETQAFTEECDDKTDGDDDQPVETFVAESEEETDMDNEKAAIMDEDTEEEDENIDVSHIFAASTLACDMADVEEEEDEPTDIKKIPHTNVDEADVDDDVATQMVNEDATQLVVAPKITEDEATQVIEEEGDSENTATQCFGDATVAVTDKATVAVTDEATVAVTEEATVAVTENATMAVTEEATVMVTENATMAITEEAMMAVTEEVTEEATMAVAEEATMAVTEEATMAVTEEATVAVTEEATVAVTENATMAITEVATMAVTEEGTVAVTEEATMAVTDEATMAIIDEATMAITEEATMAVTEEATQMFDNDKDLENDATQVIEDGPEYEETSHKNKTSRGRQGRKSKTKGVEEEEATQMLDDAITDECEPTQVAEDINVPQDMPRRRGRKSKVTERDTCNVVNDTTEDEATQVVDDVCVDSVKVSTKSKAGRGRGRKSKAKEVLEEEATQMVEDTEAGEEDQATQVIEDVETNIAKESTEKVKVPRGRPRKRGRGRETTEKEATQMVKDASTGDTVEHTKSEPGERESTEVVSGGEEATQVYGMDVDEEELDQPRGRRRQVKVSSPKQKTDQVQKDLVNLPALQPETEETDQLAGMDVEAATQKYGEESDEEDTPPLSEEMVQDSEDVLGKSPIIPLPQTSPHKSALSSPDKRNKSPSPKRVKFAVESQSSESTIGDENEKAGPSTGNTATRSKLATAEEKPKKNVTRGRRSLPAIAVEEKGVASTSAKGRRSLPASNSDNIGSGKNNGKNIKKGKLEMEDTKKLGKKEHEVEAETTTAVRRGGRRSTGVKLNDEPKVEGKTQGRKSASDDKYMKQKEENDVNLKKDKGKGRNSKFKEKNEENTLQNVKESENEVGQLTTDHDSVESKMETPADEVKGRGRGRRSIQAGGSGENKEKATKLVRVGSKRKEAEALEPASTKSNLDNLVQNDDSSLDKEEEVKGKTFRGRKSRHAPVEIQSREESPTANEVIERDRTTSRGRRSSQTSGDEVKEKEAVEEINVPTRGRGKRSKLTLVEEKVKQKSDTVEEAEKSEKVIPTPKQGSKKNNEMKDSIENTVDSTAGSTSRGKRSKQVTNIINNVEPVQEKTGRTVGGRSNKKGTSLEQVSLTEVVPEKDDQEEEEKKGKTTGRGRKSKQLVVEEETVTAKETAEPPKPRRGSRGKKVEEPSQKDSVETEEISATDLANMSGVSERRSRGRGKQKIEVTSVDSGIEGRSSRGKGKLKGDSVSADSEETEEAESEASTSRQTKTKRASKIKEVNVFNSKDSKEEHAEKESNFEQTKNRTKSRGKASNSKEDVSVTKCSEENNSSVVRKGKGRKTDTSISDTDQGEDDSVASSSRKGKTTSRGKRGHSQDQDVIETPAKKVKDKADPGTPVQSKQNVLAVDSPSLRRKSMDPKPRVMFTGMEDEQGQKTVKDLGGEMVTSIHDCTHLVTDKVRRTVKLLCCLSRGIPIVQPTWLSSSKQAGIFIQDVTPYLVKDTATEKQYKFSLQRSIERASQASVLLGYRVHVTKSVRPDPTQMKDILECAGAEYLESVPSKFKDQTVVVSCEEDRKLCQEALKADIPVVNAEFVLTGILQQDANPYNYQILNNSKKRPADSSAEGPSKRRRR
ncbi:mediator of DNA damage checkpoint protein 1-like [Pecten maximus]|uniref:mediator of DNA damage checkpoint protein 1-like n=1 Tax=Pecten maximus TaxID=6579 RepID=UPI00145832B7|nr:mediator of DNA damage checkpoint protein 1-like [Pecten maximus]